MARRPVWYRGLAIAWTATLILFLSMSGTAAAAESFWGLTADHTLVRFSSSAPGTALVTLPITGLAADEHIVAIEVEWTEGRLTGISNGGRRYEISRTSGAAVQLDPQAPIEMSAGSSYGATDDGSFLMVVAENGGAVLISKVGGRQTAIPAATPAGRIVALAWRYPGQPQRVAIDSATDSLYQFQLNAGVSTLVPIGTLGVDTSDDAGLEFGPHDDVLYATLTVGDTPALYTINPATGQAALVGALPARLISLTADLQGIPQITWNGLPGPGIAEVLESNVTLTFTVHRTGDDTVATDYAVSTDTLGYPPVVPGEDFVPVSSVLHFGVGEVEKTISVTILDDGLREDIEPFRLVVTEIGTNNPASGLTSIRIIDNENRAPALELTFPSPLALARVSTPTIAVTGLVDDEDAGAVIKIYKQGTTPSLALATTTGSPWTADVPLQPGLNRLTALVQDPHGLIDFEDFSVWRDSADDRTYVFAEGATGSFFTTDLLFVNPYSENLSVLIDFLREDGTVITHLQPLPGSQRTTLTVNTVAGLESAATAAVVRAVANYPLAVERTMRWDASGYGASTEKAASELSRTWYFAEGSQGTFFATFLLLVNPQEASNEVTVRFLREGVGPLTRTYTMSPRQRLTIDAAGESELTDTSFGIEVTFTEPGMAERAMYFGRRALWDGGHESAGATTPATSWLLAEGATGAFFETFVLVANPSDEPAEVTMTYLPEGGTPVTKTHQVAANGRLTVNIEQEDDSLANLGAVGTRLTSTVPVVVERSQYWPFSPAEWYEAHNSFGETTAATHWGLAEGRVGGGEAQYRTYILLTNPDPAATAHVRVAFLREGVSGVNKVFDVPAASRLTIDVGSAQVPEVSDGMFGADIVSDVPIAVERAMYSNANGQFWAAGTNAAATRLP